MHAEQIKSAYEAMSPAKAQRERLLRNIRAAAGQSGATKRLEGGRIKKAAFIPLVAVIILALSATALAVAVWTGVIDWEGRMETEALPAPTIAPVLQEHAAALEDAAMELLATCAENELWIVRFQAQDGTQRSASTQRCKNMDSEKDLRQTLAAAHMNWLIPASIPKGYTFRKARVSYECASEGAYRLLGSETTAEGLTLERYAAEHGADLISGYMLQYETAAGDVLRFRADLASSADDSGFGVTEDDAYEVLTIAGMENGVAITRPSDFNLFLRQRMQEPAAYRNVFAMLRKSEAEEDAFAWFDEVHYSIFSTALDIEALLKTLP
jgi:hypothetical protein